MEGATFAGTIVVVRELSPLYAGKAAACGRAAVVPSGRPTEAAVLGFIWVSGGKWKLQQVTQQ